MSKVPYTILTAIVFVYCSCGQYCENLKRRVKAPSKIQDKAYVNERDQSIGLTLGSLGKLGDTKLDARNKSLVKMLQDTLNQKSIRIKVVFSECRNLLRMDRCSEENWTLYRSTIVKVRDDITYIDELKNEVKDLSSSANLGGIEQDRIANAISKYLARSPKF